MTFRVAPVLAEDLNAILTRLDALEANQRLIAYKTSTTQRNTTTTFDDDPHLVITFPAGRYAIMGCFLLLGPTGGDFKAQLSWTGTITSISCSLEGHAIGATTAEADFRAIAASDSSASPASLGSVGTVTANWTSARPVGFMEASTSGVLTVDWAQVTSNGTNTELLKHSWLGLFPDA